MRIPLPSLVTVEFFTGIFPSFSDMFFFMASEKVILVPFSVFLMSSWFRFLTTRIWSLGVGAEPGVELRASDSLTFVCNRTMLESFSAITSVIELTS